MIFAVVGPSGAGKDTLIRGAIAARPDLTLVRRVITRPDSAGGEDHEGVSEQEFALRLARGDFAHHWRAHGLSYGIPKAQLKGPGDVIFNGSRAALPQALQAIPDLAVIVVTAPPAVLASRLAARGREAPEDIRDRLARAAFTLPEDIAATWIRNDGTEAEGVTRLLAALQPVRA
jgi:phosphonate metabolism protein PhnN/1,5-bisphosphokinase (PRPP-forming)